MNRILFILFLTLHLPNLSGKDKTCTIQNTATQPGELLTYSLSYSLAPWASVATATFEVKTTTINHQPLYNLVGKGWTSRNWSWFFEVDDTYQSWVDPVSFKPYYYQRDIFEDGFIMDVFYEFKRDNKLVYATYKKYNSKKKPEPPFSYDTVDITDCTFDVMSMLYFARNMDYNKVREGQLIPVSIIMDNEIWNIHFRYLGKENIRVPKMGRFNTLKFSVYTIEGSVFKESGESLYMWVTDDKNKIPLKIESPIIIGSVRAFLTDYKNIRNPLTSKTK